MHQQVAHITGLKTCRRPITRRGTNGGCDLAGSHGVGGKYRVAAIEKRVREKELPGSRCKTYISESALLGVLAVLRLLEDVIDDLRHVAGQVVERGHHLRPIGLEHVDLVAEPCHFLAQHFVLALERLVP